MRIFRKGTLQEYIATCPECGTEFVYDTRDTFGNTVRCPLCEYAFQVDFTELTEKTVPRLHCLGEWDCTGNDIGGVAGLTAGDYFVVSEVYSGDEEAEQFDCAALYNKGDLVIYNGKKLRCDGKGYGSMIVSKLFPAVNIRPFKEKETMPVKVGDLYVYDGAKWILCPQDVREDKGDCI